MSVLGGLLSRAALVIEPKDIFMGVCSDPSCSSEADKKRVLGRVRAMVMAARGRLRDAVRQRQSPPAPVPSAPDAADDGPGARW
jgi:hypothetical protein